MKMKLPSTTTTRNIGIFRFWATNKKCKNPKQGVKCRYPHVPDENYVVEKYCGPSIFEQWKPKIPDLSCNDVPLSKIPYPEKKECFPGMKIGEDRCKLDREAEERQRMNHPKWVHRCPPKPKYHVVGPEAIPQKDAIARCTGESSKAAKPKGEKSLRKKCEPNIPTGDWNADGSLN